MVKDIYTALLRRLPEPDAVEYCSKMIADGRLCEVLNFILESDEFNRAYLEGTEPFSLIHPVDMVYKPVDIFIHIPKAAGTSLYSMLVRAFGERYITPPFIRLSSKPPSWVYRYNLLFGHFDYDEIMLLIMQQNKRLFTFLRDPVKRLISTYYYWQSQDTKVKSLDELLIANKLNIKEFFTDQDVIEKMHFFNEITRYVIGFGAWKEWKERYKSLKNKDEIGRFIEDEVRGKVRERLKEFTFIGLQEDFERSTRALFYVLGKDYPGIVRTNVTSENMNKWGFKKIEREEITPEVRDALENITRLDRVIYDEGKKIYLDFVRKLSEISAIPFSIDFSSGGNSGRFIAKGFCGVEPWGTWSSGKEAAIAFNLAETAEKPKFMKLYFNILTRNSYSQTFEFYLNDKLLDKKTYNVEYDELKLDISNYAKRENILTIKMLNAVSPKALGINEDTRELGIGLVKVELFR